jgi:hypothetical protein
MLQPHSDGSISSRTWAWLVLGATVLAAALIAAFNAVIDPTAQLGTGLFDPVAAGPRDRIAKTELLATAAPASDLVVLGSSRSKKLDPAWLDAQRGINAAVVGGDLFEARVLAAWIAKLGDDFPQLVVGIDVEQLRDSSLQGSGFLDVPELAPIARREAAGSDGSLAGELDRLERLLLNWQVTKASIASARARLRAGSSGAAHGSAADRDEFTDAGVPVDDARWFDAQVAARRARATPGAIDRNVEELRTTYENVGARLDPDAVGDLRALVRIARDAGGPQPLLYVTPGNPALDSLDSLGRADRHAAVLELLRSLERDGLATVVDCERCIDDATTSWIDATHPSPLGMRQLATELAAQAPSATPTERSGASR